MRQKDFRCPTQALACVQPCFVSNGKQARKECFGVQSRRNSCAHPKNVSKELFVACFVGAPVHAHVHLVAGIKKTEIAKAVPIS